MSCYCIKIGMSFVSHSLSQVGVDIVFCERVPHGPQQSVPEGMFDDSIDLVVWGHEHDCRISPEPVAGKRYGISQPGSSVATSLSEGEALEKCLSLPHFHHLQSLLTSFQMRRFIGDMRQAFQAYTHTSEDRSTVCHG